MSSSYNEVFSSRDATVARGSGRSRVTSTDTDDAGSTARAGSAGSAGSTGVPRADALSDSTIDPKFLPDGRCPSVDDMAEAAKFLAQMVPTIRGMDIISHHIDLTPLAHDGI